ncbi:MAG: hypothetical protein MUP62_04610 [Dehalococcoidia bacterium]|nr:hypothetical protein [Dehalococcoidia bacterium]
MSDKDTKEKGKEEVRAEERQGFAEMCRRMMSGGAPDCCGPQMREMMSRFCRSAGKTEGEAKG